MTEERNGMVDYGRFIASLGFVWFSSHAPGERIAYIALPFFLVLISTPSQASIATHARRLLLPFVIWSLVFTGLHFAFSIKNQAPLFGWWDWHMLLTGTWMHLWFLPFAFLAAILAPWFQHPLASLGAAILAAVLLSLEGAPTAVPFGLWSFGIIPVLVGIAYFSWGWRLAVVTLLTSWLILNFGRPSPDNITILAGTSLALLFLSSRMPSSPLSQWCARLSMSIYLAHPLVLIIGQSLRITYVELALFSIVGSVLLALLIESSLQGSRRGRLELS